jgi:hypothetical protein
MGLKVVGTAARLVMAKDRGLIDAVRPLLDALLACGFRLSRTVYEKILAIAGERNMDDLRPQPVPPIFPTTYDEVGPEHSSVAHSE